MATVREELLQSYRSWIKSVLGLSDSQVIIHQRGGLGPRPPLPFISVHMPNFDNPKGVDEKFLLDDGTTIYKGNRTGTLAVNGYGDDTEEWLSTLGAKVSRYDGPSSIVNQGSTVTDVSLQMNKAEFESKYIKEFPVEYAIRIVEADGPAVAAESIEITNVAGTPAVTKILTVELI